MNATAHDLQRARGMPQTVQLSAGHVAAMLRAWQRNAQTALQWVHPSWSAAAFGCTETAFSAWFAEAGDRCVEPCSVALLHVLLPAMPSLERLNASIASRIDALPIDAGLRVLRLYALLFRRAEVRRLIDRDTRKRLAQWIGGPLDTLTSTTLLDAAASHDIARASQTATIPALETLDAEQLAFEGYVRFTHGSDVLPCPLLRLALSREVPDASRWLDTLPRQGDVHASQRFHRCLKEFLPEFAWLSG